MKQEKIPIIIIIGAGLGGLTLYHALIKNKDKKEFNVKIFEREPGPKDRWQGYHIGLSNHGVRYLINCIPPSISSKLPKAIPDPIPDVEFHGISIIDHMGNPLFQPLLKQYKDVYELSKISCGHSVAVAYRDRLRDVLLESVPLHWGKKFVRYEETLEGVWVFFEDGSREFCDILVGADGINSLVRKQKIPELKISEHEVNYVITDLAVPKHLIDRLIKIHGNFIARKTLGIKGDTSFFASRLIPIEHDKDKDKNFFKELYYRATLVYTYSSELDKLDDSDPDKIEIVDNNDPELVIQRVKQLIRKTRPKCEVTDIELELWNLVSKTNDPENFSFKNYIPVQIRKIRDINPLSVKSWISSRVTLLGDAAHAMSPILALGANNAIQDADILSQALLKSKDNYDHISCIKEYENEMIKRTSADVLKSRSATLKQSVPVGYFGYIIRNSIFKLTEALINVYNLITDMIFSR